MRSASAADFNATRFIARLRSRGLTWVLAIAVVLLQYPLWLGEGGWLRVREGAQKIDIQLALNQRLEVRNASLLAEINDLKQGRDAIEERARNDLGMVAPDEWFVRVVPAQSVQSGKTNE
ncbi:cell division protein FtsB [Thiobacillus thioparus]|jgi:cell division protein FtsB|uniref:cell division protein FtsB n=1 Tax=Thiobacillus thioparus TaxID=931 RepID=UPI000371F22D|nr:cell division protein FtsB [Thiobacillus thioparus]